MEAVGRSCSTQIPGLEISARMSPGAACLIGQNGLSTVMRERLVFLVHRTVRHLLFFLLPHHSFTGHTRLWHVLVCGAVAICLGS